MVAVSAAVTDGRAGGRVGPLVVNAASPVQRMFAVRESDNDHELLAGMLDQTLRQYRDVPGVEEAIALGLDPYLHPDRYDDVVLHISTAQDRAVSFVRHGTLFLIWGGSAARTDDRGENPFVEHVARTVKLFGIDHLYVSNFSRLVRSQDVQPKLRRHLVEQGTRVYCGAHTLEMANDQGRLIWDVLAMVFSMERDAIEQRLMIGQIFAARQGLWPSLPPPVGYEIVDDGNGARLRVSEDPEEQRRARQMIAVMASEGTARQKFTRLEAIGIKLYRNVDGGREPFAPSEAREPANALSAFHARLKLYRDGQWTYRRRLPRNTSVDEVAGVPVQYDDTEDGRPFVEIPVPVGVPEEGWADDATFAAWEAERGRRSRDGGGGGAEHPYVKPLSGLSHYRRDDFEYALGSDGRDAYVLRRRPFDPETYGRGWDAEKRASEQIFKVDSRRLHTSISDGIEGALTGGHDLTLLDAAVEATDDGYAEILFLDPATRRAERDRKTAELTVKRDRAMDLAVQTEQAAVRARYHEQAEELSRRITELEAEIIDPPAGPPSAPVTVIVYGRTILAALEQLRSSDMRVERRFAAALRTVVTDLTFEVADDTLHWSLDLRLPTSEGLAVLRGIRGSVDGFGRPPRYRYEKNREAASNAFLDALADGGGFSEAVTAAKQHHVAPSVSLIWTALNRHGIRSDDARGILLSQHPSFDVARLLLCDALGRPQPSDLDPDWVAYLHTVADGEVASINLGAAKGWAQRRLAVLDSLDPAAPRTIPEIADRVGVARGKIPRLLGYDNIGKGPGIRELRPRNEPSSPVIATYDPDEQPLRFTPRACAHCHAAELMPLFVPDIRGLLCRHCLRIAEQPDLPAMPASYRHWLEQVPISTHLRWYQCDPDVVNQAIPDGPFTARQWWERAGGRARRINDLIESYLADGLLEALDPDPDSVEVGMPPKRYQLTERGRATIPTADPESREQRS